jgi:hypothetical protein
MPPFSHTLGGSRQPPSWNYFHYSKTVLWRENEPCQSMCTLMVSPDTHSPSPAAAADSRHLGVSFTPPKLFCGGRMNLTNPCVCWWCLLIHALHHLIPRTALSHTWQQHGRQPPSWKYFPYSKTVLYREWMNLTNPCVCWWCLLKHALHHLISCTALTHVATAGQTAAILELFSLLQNCTVERVDEPYQSMCMLMVSPDTCSPSPDTMHGSLTHVAAAGQTAAILECGLSGRGISSPHVILFHP